MGYKTRDWRNSMRVTLDYNNMTEKFLGDTVCPAGVLHRQGHAAVFLLLPVHALFGGGNPEQVVFRNNMLFPGHITVPSASSTGRTSAG